MAGAYEELQNQIEAVRREARAEGYKAGYAAAMEAVAEFTKGASKPAASAAQPRSKANGQTAASARRPRGENRQSVFKVIASGGHPLGATEIATATGISYSSVRHALDQLTEQGRLVTVGRGQWTTKMTSAPNGAGADA